MRDAAISTLVYGILTFVAAVGTLEVAALRGGREGLAWPVGVRHRRLGYLLAGLMLAVAFLGGMFLRLLVEPPSPLLSAAAIPVAVGLALVVAIVGAAVRMRWSQRRHESFPSKGRVVEFGPLRATFYQPEGRGPVPGICLLPDPAAPGDGLGALARALVEAEMAVLLFDWRSVRNADRLTLQGLVAMGISQLTRWSEIDAGQVGLAGVGVGGDLALRSAAMDPGVAAVLAIEPVLSPRRPGAGLEALDALSWFGAQRRAHRWRRSTLVRELNALAAVPCIAPRPAAIVVISPGDSEAVGSLEILRAEPACLHTPAAHTLAMRLAADWLKVHLV